MKERGEVFEEAIDYFVVKSVILLTILQYFPFEKFGRVVGNLFNIQMIYKHLPLYIGMWVCLIWVMVSLIIFIKFVCFQRYDVVGGYEVKDIKEEKMPD